MRGQHHAPAALYPWERPGTPLYRRLGGPQGRSGRVGKISPPPGFDTQTVQPIASRYIDYATRPLEKSAVSLIWYLTTSYHMRLALFWDSSQRRMVVSYPRFRTTFRSRLQGSSSPRRRWDQYVVPKRRYETAILRHIKSQKNTDLIYTAAYAWYHESYHMFRVLGLSSMKRVVVTIFTTRVRTETLHFIPQSTVRAINSDSVPVQHWLIEAHRVFWTVKLNLFMCCRFIF